MNFNQNQEIPEPTKVLKQAVYLTGSIAALSRHTGISKSTLRSISTGKHKPTIATIFRLQGFVDYHESRRGRPLKKGG